MPTRKAWDNPDYEGKALRKVFTRTLKRYMKEESNPRSDPNELKQLAHLLTIIARSKQDLAKYAYQDKRIKALESYLDSKQLKKIIEVGELPAIP